MGSSAVMRAPRSPVPIIAMTRDVIVRLMTRRVVSYDRTMRWAPDARGRLERAAFELFAEQGFAATTVPQITARAGLTTRTFFRHFTDKREVVFAGSEIPETAARLIVGAPADLDPTQVVRHVLHQIAAARFDGHHEQTAAWRRIIEGNDELRDRDARKRSDLVRAAQAAFVERGQTPLQATVVAELGVLVFQVALEQWAAGTGERSLAETIDEVSTLVRERTTPAPGAHSSGTRPVSDHPAD
ncbi:TetR family transcriptional regulator [Curtobacterium sp. MCBD17_008]|nr:TetR family transcriptional regulator [Curtobacterium sp. MCBD17_008]